MTTPPNADLPRLAAFELFCSSDLSAPVQIQPCRACEPWFVEVEPNDGHVLVREWHAEDCPHLRTLLADDLIDGD